MDEASVRALLQNERQAFQTQVTGMLEEANQRAQRAEQDAANARDLLRTAMTMTERPTRAPSTEEKRELGSIIDVRILEGLEPFDGQDTHWESWYTGFEALTGLIGLDLIMSASSGRITVAECSLAQLPDDETRIQAKALWYILTQACKGKARSLVKKAEKFNGAQAWKILHDEYRPSLAGRFNAMLMGILRPQWDSARPFLDQLASWEVECVEYTSQSAQDLSDNTRMAVVSSCCPEGVRWVVRMAALQHGGSYHAFKAHIELYMKQSQEFGSTGFDGPTPMDVGGIGWKGKGKRKQRKTTVSRNCMFGLQQDWAHEQRLLASRWCRPKRKDQRLRQEQGQE